MTTAIVQREGEIRPEFFPTTVAGIQNRRKKIREIMKLELRYDVDWGVIPGTKKPSLYKDGAHKLLNLFGLAGVPDDPQVRELEDGHREYTCSYKIYHHGELVGAQIGMASTMEKKFWHSLKGGGPKQPVSNPADIYHNVMQRAIKRAMVGAATQVLACGDIFSAGDGEPTGKPLNWRDLDTALKQNNITGPKIWAYIEQVTGKKVARLDQLTAAEIASLILNLEGETVDDVPAAPAPEGPGPSPGEEW